jgi:hypothetical protein
MHELTARFSYRIPEGFFFPERSGMDWKKKPP